MGLTNATFLISIFVYMLDPKNLFFRAELKLYMVNIRFKLIYLLLFLPYYLF